MRGPVIDAATVAVRATDVCVNSWPAGQLSLSALHAVCPPCAPLPFRSVWPTTKLRCASVAFPRAVFWLRVRARCLVLGSMQQATQDNSKAQRVVRCAWECSTRGVEHKPARHTQHVSAHSESEGLGLQTAAGAGAGWTVEEWSHYRGGGCESEGWGMERGSGSDKLGVQRVPPQRAVEGYAPENSGLK